MFDVLFDAAFTLPGRKGEVHRTTLPFLPRVQEHIALNGTTYIVTKIEYDLSAYRGQGNSIIPVTVIVRRKTDNDF